VYPPALEREISQDVTFWVNRAHQKTWVVIVSFEMTAAAKLGAHTMTDHSGVISSLTASFFMVEVGFEFRALPLQSRNSTT
jgi:hypothetical protein